MIGVSSYVKRASGKWPFYYFHKDAGWRWNLANYTFAFADWIYYKVYNRLMNFGHNVGEKDKKSRQDRD